tara:strand:+ start:1094 stop:2260 length:1167 start_codon:yes stop_codon:yes gene_type:complete
MNKVLIQTLNIGIKDKKHDGVLFKLPFKSKVSIVATKNKFAAAPVILNKINVKNKPKYLFVNSGNANAGTGSQGMKNAVKFTKIISKEVKCKSNEILLFSTGIIGQQLPMKKIEKKLISARYDYKCSWTAASKAIMTTDKFNKIISQKIVVSGKKVDVHAICKGAGMIEPNMATMLSFVSLDLNIKKKNLDSLLKRIVDKTFNRITVDGDMSTNDSVALIATGGNSHIKTDSLKILGEIEHQLEIIFTHLSEMIVKDGEGATKLVTINVLKSKTESSAKKICYSIANSNLFKTAMHGSDANWGRIIAKLGSIDGINFTPSKVKLFINDILLFENGTNAKISNHKKLQSTMKNKKIQIDLLLNNGSKSYTIKTSDLSKQYVHLNSAYPS